MKYSQTFVSSCSVQVAATCAKLPVPVSRSTTRVAPRVTTLTPLLARRQVALFVHWHWALTLHQWTHGWARRRRVSADWEGAFTVHELHHTIAVTVWKIPTLKSQTSFYREMYRHVSDGMGLTFTSIFLSCLYIVRSYDDTPMSPYISTINRI